MIRTTSTAGSPSRYPRYMKPARVTKALTALTTRKVRQRIPVAASAAKITALGSGSK